MSVFPHGEWREGRPLPPAAEAMLVGLADAVGLSWRVGQWPGDGRVVQANNAVDLSHEIAHFVMASPSARRWRFYGLGSPSSGVPARAYFTKGFCHRQENLASLLGIGILATCGASAALLRWNLADHSWLDSTGPQIQGIAWSLLDRGLVWFRSETSRVPIADLPAVVEYARGPRRIGGVNVAVSA